MRASSHPRFLLPLLSIALVGGGAFQQGTDWQMPRYDAARPMARSGFVRRTTVLASPDPALATVVLDLARERDTIEVYLGPRWFVEPRLIGPVRGERASVRGARAFFRGRVVIVAATLVTEHSTLVLRDSTGTPLWKNPPITLVAAPRPRAAHGASRGSPAR
jgi:hypothetical protein